MGLGFVLSGTGIIGRPGKQVASVPELPEVETTRRGIAPHVTGQRVARVVVREPRLRWPVPDDLAERLAGCRIEAVERRAKYLLIETDRGTALLHLGMSGSLRILARPQPPGRHDHVDIELESGSLLRFNDPRRFGSLLWAGLNPRAHPLLAALGPEPLGDSFTGDWLYRRSRGRRGAVKNFLMDQKIVVGVGNIYASESLYLARINPARAAGRISISRYGHLAETVRAVLERAIAAGGTTLRDFVDSQGQPGYFQQSLAVYDQAGKPCAVCGQPIRRRVLGQRATYYCARCQR